MKMQLLNLNSSLLVPDVAISLTYILLELEMSFLAAQNLLKKFGFAQAVFCLLSIYDLDVVKCARSLYAAVRVAAYGTESTLQCFLSALQLSLRAIRSYIIQ